MEQPEGTSAERAGLAVGMQVGNYRVTQKLGEGGMGSVYLAEHPLIGKRVAIKVLHPELSYNQDIVTRFFNEARAVNDIQHANIVDIVDYGKLPNPESGHNDVYFIMEFITGPSLATVVREQAPLPPQRALKICRQIASALDASHRAGIVHRDLKPDNVILAGRGDDTDFVKVLDFGIAKLTGERGGARRTRTGVVMGTPAYMSPEQCEGKGSVDHRTDVYALGILLFECLTGRTPFDGDGYGEIIVQHMTAPAPSASSLVASVPAALDAVCLKMLEKDPKARFPSMTEVIRAFADPAGYVQKFGGVDAFLPHRRVAPAPAALAAPAQHAAVAPTPSPAPVPATVQAPAPPSMAVPATAPPPSMAVPAAPRPQVAPAVVSAPTYAPPPANNTRRLIAIVSSVVVVAAVGIAIAVSGGEESETAAAVEGALGDAAVAEAADAGGAVAEPATVEIEVVTRPAGAEVLLVEAGGERSLGVTPNKFEIPRSDAQQTLKLALFGYETRLELVAPNQDAIDVALTATRAADAGAEPELGDERQDRAARDRPNRTTAAAKQRARDRRNATRARKGRQPHGAQKRTKPETGDTGLLGPED